jgi:lysophospholipase L1-like esterase
MPIDFRHRRNRAPFQRTMTSFHLHRASILRLAICLLLGTIHALALEAPVRIMPLGDSLTFGEANTSVQGGYRNSLYGQLSTAGYNVDFVGTFSDDDNQDLPDTDHQGIPGYRTDQILANINEWLDSVEDPDIVLLLVGTNDIWQNHLYPGNFPLEQTEANLTNLIATIATRRPFVKIIVSNLPQRTDDLAIEADQAVFNSHLPALVAQQVALGHQVSLVDMHSVLTPLDYSSDGVHPSTAGYNKMADTWTPAITETITPQGSFNPPLIARTTPHADPTHLSIHFSKPISDDAATPVNFSISGGLTISSAVLDPATKRTVTLTTSQQIPGSQYILSVSGVTDRTAQQTPIAPDSMTSFTRDLITNGSFEEFYAGWTATGNSEIQLDGTYGYESTDGSYLVSFNSGDENPGGSLSQTIATTAGRTYSLLFDYGILSSNNNPQQLGLTIQGTNELLSESLTIQRQGNTGIRWVEETYSFTADSSSTAITFDDESLVINSNSVDLLLDNVRVELQEIPALAITSSPFSGVNVALSHNDISSHGNGTTGLIRFYNPGTLITVTAPSVAQGKNFIMWRRNGVDLPASGNAITVAMDSSIVLDAVYDPDTPPTITEYEKWQLTHGISALPGEDSDGDSIPDAIEFVLGGNPVNEADQHRLPVTAIVNEDPDGDSTPSDYLCFTFRRTNLANSDPETSISVEWSTNPAGPWINSTDTQGTVTLDEPDPVETNADLVHVYLPATLGPGGKLFARLRVIIAIP